MDTPNWRVCITADNGRSALETAVARINLTDVTTTLTCASINLNAIAANYPDSWFGFADCTGTQTGGVCTFYRVRLNLSTAVSAQQRRKTATHEFGHVAGLGHRDGNNNTCMASGNSPPISETYDGHDSEAINNAY